MNHHNEDKELDEIFGTDKYQEAMHNADIQMQQQFESESITALQLFEKGLTKKDLKVMAEAAVESVLHKGNPLQVAEALTAMEKFCDEVKGTKSFKEYVREETAKTPKGYISPSGAKIELAEVGSSYDFSACNDTQLTEMESKLLESTNEVKARKEFLKTIPAKGMELLDKSTGELVMVYPPLKTSTSSYKITLAK